MKNTTKKVWAKPTIKEIKVKTITNQGAADKNYSQNEIGNTSGPKGS